MGEEEAVVAVVVAVFLALCHRLCRLESLAC